MDILLYIAGPYVPLYILLLLLLLLSADGMLYTCICESRIRFQPVFFFRISTTDYHSSVVDHDRVTLIIFFFFQDVIVFLFIRLVLSCFLVAIYRQWDIILLAIEIS